MWPERLRKELHRFSGREVSAYVMFFAAFFSRDDSVKARRSAALGTA
jgi:hypothetical protein